MVSWKFCYRKAFCVFLYGERVYILSFTDVLHANIFLWTIKETIYTRTIKESELCEQAKFWGDSKSKDDKTQSEGK